MAGWAIVGSEKVGITMRVDVGPDERFGSGLVFGG
jgi:hypothetical protein